MARCFLILKVYPFTSWPLQNLRRKAEERNPDEFYFAMQGKSTKGGVVAGRYCTQLCVPCQDITNGALSCY